MSVVCCKVKYLRPQYNDLHDRITNDSNFIYIARRGVVFINGVRYPPKDSIWANPFKITPSATREEVISKYKKYILARLDDPSDNVITRNALEELRGKTLGCWCKPESCHGDVLIELLEVRSAQFGLS